MALRTDLCGELSLDDVDREVVVCGWVHRRREHGEHLAFVDVRDHTGLVQTVVDGSVDVRSEYVVQVSGTVRRRPEGTENPNLDSGDIELADCTVEILTASEPPPFPLDRAAEVDEVTRIRHRYVDLRTERLQHNLRLRARINGAIRDAMEEQDFVEIETPNLIASTPEGARDFVVPSRLHPGSFYALPQSPQLFKQLCMVGGIDRYYQIARCFRDEDLRADRQFEFSQLDLEMSFVDQDDVLAAVEHAVRVATYEATGEDPGEFDRMPWLEAMERFGSDKPDLRFGMELTELTDLFGDTEFKVFQAPSVKGIRHEGGGDIGRNQLDALTDTAKRWGAKGLVWMKVGADGELTSPIAKFLSEAELTGICERLGGEEGDILYLVADDRHTVWHVLGLLRLELGRPPVNEGGLNFLWVTEFPLFEAMNEDGTGVPAHHPFTMPHPDDIEALVPGGDLLSIRSQAYDLVLNGWELGSGSVRIHRGDIQQQVFTVLGFEPEEAQRRFGFLLDAFRFGAPPHAGFAFGLDRLVALLAGEENIREVIAFPKTQSGTDPLTTAPTEIDARHLDELGLRLLPKAE
ncbi:MAG: aspartate--tRNA ligase [Actinomycetota bacterium]